MALGANTTLGLTFTVNGTAAALSTVNTFRAGIVGAAADMNRNWAGSVDMIERRLSRLSVGLESGLKRSFFAAASSVGVLTYAFTGLSRSFIEVNQKFNEFEITLGSSLKSVRAAREIVSEVAKITATSPIPFKDIAESISGLTVLPQLNAQFTRQVREGTLGDPQGLTRKSISLVEMMTSFRPDKRPEDAVFSIREALTGEFRSLQRRFDVPISILQEASGKTISRLKSEGPEAILDSMYKAFSNIISPEAVRQRAQQPTVLMENLFEQLFQQPSLSIGRAGFMGTLTNRFSGYLNTSARFFTSNPDDIGSGQFERGGYSDRISLAMSKSFERIMEAAEEGVDGVLRSFGLSQGSVLERASQGLANAFEYISENIPQWLENATAIAKKGYELAKSFVEILTTMSNIFLSVTKNLGPGMTLLVGAFAPKTIGLIVEGIGRLAFSRISPLLTSATRTVGTAVLGSVAGTGSVLGGFSSSIGDIFRTYSQSAQLRDRLNDFHLNYGRQRGRVQDYADVFNTLGMTRGGMPFNYNTRATTNDIFVADRALSRPLMTLSTRLIAVVGPMVAFTAAIALASYTVTSFYKILKEKQEADKRDTDQRMARAQVPLRNLQDLKIIAAGNNLNINAATSLEAGYNADLAKLGVLTNKNEETKNRVKAIRELVSKYDLKVPDEYTYRDRSGQTKFNVDSKGLQDFIATGIAQTFTRAIAGLRGNRTLAETLSSALNVKTIEDIFVEYQKDAIRKKYTGKDAELLMREVGGIESIITSTSVSAAQAPLMPLIEARLKQGSPNADTLEQLSRFNEAYRYQQGELQSVRQTLSEKGLNENLLERANAALATIMAQRDRLNREDPNAGGKFTYGGEIIDANQRVAELTALRDSIKGIDGALNYVDRTMQTLNAFYGSNQGKSLLTNLSVGQSILSSGYDVYGKASESQRPALLKQLQESMGKIELGDPEIKGLMSETLSGLSDAFNDTSFMDGLEKYTADLDNLSKRAEYYAKVNDIAAYAIFKLGTGSEAYADLQKLQTTSQLELAAANDDYSRKLKEYSKQLDQLSMDAAARSARDTLTMIRDARSRGYRVSGDRIRGAAEDYAMNADLGAFDSLRAGFGSQFVSGDDFKNMAQIGIQSAQAIKGAFGDALYSVAKNAENAGQAFRAMAVSIADSMARILANKAAEGLLNMAFQGAFNFFGSGAATSSFATSAPVAGNFSGTTMAPQTSQFSGGGFSGTSASFGGMYSAGGPITKGSGTKDDVHILAMRGEYVLNKKAVQMLGRERLDQWNRGDIHQYATGGAVGSYSTPSYVQSMQSGSAPVSVSVNYNAQGGRMENSSGGSANTEKELARMLEASVVKTIEEYDRKRRFYR